MQTFTQRIIGAALLKSSTYEEVEADTSSTGAAMGVVLLSAVAAGIGARGFGGPMSSLPGTALVALLAWGAWAMLTYQIGAKLLPGPETHADFGELLRTIGFASAPGILRIVGVVPVLAMPVFALTAVWMLLAMVVAVRQALDYSSTGRALAVCGLSWLLVLAVVLAFGLFVGPGLI